MVDQYELRGYEAAEAVEWDGMGGLCGRDNGYLLGVVLCCVVVRACVVRVACFSDGY